MKLVFISLMALLLGGCATPSKQTDRILKGKTDLPKKAKIENIPLIIEKDFNCGPASLTMILQYMLIPTSVDEISKKTFSPGGNGTYQTDLVTAVRREGLLAIPLENLESILREVSLGNPVLVFQNLGLSNLPRWHYSVATGYNLKGPDIVLHSGKKEAEKMDLGLFERTWKLGGDWAIVILRPGGISVSATEVSHVSAAAGLEQVQNFEGAKKSYEGILLRWPHSLLAELGLGNVYFSQKDYRASKDHLLKATQKHPHSALAWHNLAFAYEALKDERKAKQSADMAMSLADDQNREMLKKSLNKWIY